MSEPEFLHMWMNHPSNGESHALLRRVPALGAHLPEDGPLLLLLPVGRGRGVGERARGAAAAEPDHDGDRAAATGPVARRRTPVTNKIGLAVRVSMAGRMGPFATGCTESEPRPSKGVLRPMRPKLSLIARHCHSSAAGRLLCRQAG
ncbi:MAG: hypothetical protein MZV63_63060 [Marinilabiliales bacterium]|nr:hypothetical protein [Marinilabiliales bacterium]